MEGTRERESQSGHWFALVGVASISRDLNRAAAANKNTTPLARPINSGLCFRQPPPFANHLNRNRLLLSSRCVFATTASQRLFHALVGYCAKIDRNDGRELFCSEMGICPSSLHVIVSYAPVAIPAGAKVNLVVETRLKKHHEVVFT